MEANKKRFIRVAGELIEVTEEVYLTYYRGKRREKAQREKNNPTMSYLLMRLIQRVYRERR